MITEQEILIARHCITTAVSKGAASARVSMSKSMMDGYTFLNGDLDKVTHSADRSLYIHLLLMADMAHSQQIDLNIKKLRTLFPRPSLW